MGEWVVPDAVRVLIVDDQAPFRRAAHSVVGLTPGFDVVAEAETGEDALRLVEEHQPELVLMDVNMPGIDGCEASRRITAARPSTVVLLVSTYSVDDLPSDARSCGAAEYLSKEDLAPDVLTDAWSRHAPPGGAT
jgi:DNA-binding NarL/FixJ family response regulator